MTEQQGLMTLKDIAARLGLPESSLRKYRDVFPQFIPSVGTGRDRRYRDEAVEVFRTIREMREVSHLAWEDMESRLAARFPVNTEMLTSGDRDAEEPGLAAELETRLSDVERMVRRTLALLESQHVVLNALGGEFLKMKASMQLLQGIRDDGQVVRRSLFANQEYNMKLGRDHRERIEALQEKVMDVHSALMYMLRMLEKGQSATSAESHAASSREKELEALAVERVRELEDMRSRLATLRADNEHLRTRVAELTALVPETKSAPDQRKGSTMLFRRRNPKEKRSELIPLDKD
jgi:hypothetical protein